MIAVALLALACFASVALGAGTAYLVVRWTRKPVLWALAPVFALVWLVLGSAPLGTFFWTAARSPAPVVAPPAPVVGPAGGGPAAGVGSGRSPGYRGICRVFRPSDLPP